MSGPFGALAQLSGQGWLVGGALRDELLGRETSDFDVVLAADVERVARALGRAAGGFAFELSETFGAWRVVDHDRAWQVDLVPLEGDAIEEDLARRDLTVNAIARPLGSELLIDPFGGADDLRRRLLRLVAPDALTRDPLRVLRLARQACELGFAVEADTERAAHATAAALREVAPERVFAELRRLICADAALAGLELMDRIGATDAVLPELTALRGVEQSRFHHLDVLGHTLAALAQTIELTRDPAPFCASASDAETVRALLAEPLANELTRGQALRFGALLHDIAKPRTRAVAPGGRITFMGHDELGAAISSEILGRLRASDRLRDHVAALCRHHLRLGFLVHETPLTRRAVYSYLHDCAPVAIDVTLLSVADRLATRGDNAERAIAAHLELARQLIGEAVAWAADPPRPPVRGDVLARALGIEPGPVVGGLLAELQAARFSGELQTAEQAIERARQLIAERR
jgi:poly(A) polymerase